MAEEQKDEPRNTSDEDTMVEVPESTVEIPARKASSSVSQNKLRQVWAWSLHHKKITLPVTVAVLLTVLTAIPFTRYILAGTIVRQNFSVRVTDKATKKPVSGVEVILQGKKALTDNQGRATIRANAGESVLKVSKKYYKGDSREVLVPILKQKDVLGITIEATGRQVPVTVTNKITKKPLADVAFKVLGAETKTDKQGKAILVLPADKDKAEASLSASGYNSANVSVTVSAEETKSNAFELTPAGKIYFLSNQTGRLDVVKSNLDGSDRKVVLAGTGKEEKQNTVLLASRDWKYLALLSKRDGGEYAKLFLIDTSTDSLTVMDEGKAGFNLYGWSDHRFVYRVQRSEVKAWEPKQQALKSYDANGRKITTLDQTAAEGNEYGYAAQDFSSVFLIKDQVVYSIGWGGYTQQTKGKSAIIRGIKADGQGKKDYKTFDANQYQPYISANPYEFNEIYYLVYEWNNAKEAFFEFEDNAVKPAQTTREAFYEPYPTYFISPSAGHTFWSESRDGKSVLFIGNEEAGQGKQIAPPLSYQTHGWFTDNYVLVSKDSSELYILSAEGLKEGEQPLKVTDYYKPDYVIRGYGGGY